MIQRYIYRLINRAVDARLYARRTEGKGTRIGIDIWSDEKRRDAVMLNYTKVCVRVCLCVCVCVCERNNQEGKLIFHTMAKDRARSADFGINIKTRTELRLFGSPPFILGVVS